MSLEPWHIEGRSASRALTAVEQCASDARARAHPAAQCLMHAVGATVVTCVVTGCTSGQKLRDRVETAWMRLPFDAPAAACSYSLEKDRATYDGVREGWLAAIHWHEGLAEGELHLSLLAGPVVPCDDHYPTRLHINERPNALDVALFGPHHFLDGRTARAALNLLAGYIKHGTTVDVPWGEELSRLPHDADFFAQRPPPTETDIAWAKEHPIQDSSYNRQTLVVGPLSGQGEDAVEITKVVLSEAESTGLHQAARYHGATVGLLVETAAALAIMRTCFDWADEERTRSWRYLLTYCGVDLVARLPLDKQRGALGTNIYPYTNLVAVDQADMDAIEDGHLGPGFFAIVAEIRAKRDLHLNPDSPTWRTRLLQRKMAFEHARKGGKDQTPLGNDAPLAIAVTNTGRISDYCQTLLGDPTTHYDDVLATPHMRAPLLAHGISTLHGRTKFALQTQKGAYKPGFTAQHFARFLRYIRVIINSAVTTNGRAH